MSWWKKLFGSHDAGSGSVNAKTTLPPKPTVPVASSPKPAAMPAPPPQALSKSEPKLDMKKIVWSVVHPLQTTLQDPNKIIELGAGCVPVVIDVFLNPKEPSTGIACNQAILAMVLGTFARRGDKRAGDFLRDIASDRVDLYDTWGQSAYNSAKAYVTEQDPSASNLQKFRTANPDYELKFKGATSLMHKFISSSTGSHDLFLVGGASLDALLEEIRRAFKQNFWTSEEDSVSMSILGDIAEDDVPTWWVSEERSVEERTVRRSDGTIGWHLWADKSAGKCHMWRWYRKKS